MGMSYCSLIFFYVIKFTPYLIKIIIINQMLLSLVFIYNKKSSVLIIGGFLFLLDILTGSLL